MNKDNPCESINCYTCKYHFHNRSTATMHKICHMQYWYEEVSQDEFKNKQWNFIKARRAKKEKVQITQEEINQAKEEYFKKGGKITLLENPAYTDYYNSFNIHSFEELGVRASVSIARNNLAILREKTNLIMR